MMKKKIHMSRVFFVLVMIAALVGLSGCASIAGTFGIASEQYVDEKMSEAEGQLSSRIDDNRSKVDKYASTADQLEELIGSVEDAVATTDELKQLAVILEERLNNLPQETIKQLVDVLQQYLDAAMPKPM
jgi:hypothetical protein